MKKYILSSLWVGVPLGLVVAIGAYIYLNAQGASLLHVLKLHGGDPLIVPLYVLLLRYLFTDNKKSQMTIQSFVDDVLWMGCVMPVAAACIALPFLGHYSLFVGIGAFVLVILVYVSLALFLWMVVGFIRLVEKIVSRSH